jgi:hypothetical protein
MVVVVGWCAGHRKQIVIHSYISKILPIFPNASVNNMNRKVNIKPVLQISRGRQLVEVSIINIDLVSRNVKKS